MSKKNTSRGKIAKGKFRILGGNLPATETSDCRDAAGNFVTRTVQEGFFFSTAPGVADALAHEEAKRLANEAAGCYIPHLRFEFEDLGDGATYAEVETAGGPIWDDYNQQVKWTFEGSRQTATPPAPGNETAALPAKWHWCQWHRYDANGPIDGTYKTIFIFTKVGVPTVIKV